MAVYDILLNINTSKNKVIMNALLPDLKESDRIKIKVIKKDPISIKISSTDVTSLRAGVNSVLKLIKVAEDVLEV